MLRLIFSALIILGLGFGYTNFTNIEDSFYDAADTVNEISETAVNKANNRMHKFVEPAKDAYGSAVDERDRQIARDLQE